MATKKKTTPKPPKGGLKVKGKAAKKAPARKRTTAKPAVQSEIENTQSEMQEVPQVQPSAVVGVAPLQQGVVTNGANEVIGNTAIPVSEVNEIWESEERKRRRLESDPSLRAM